MKKLLIILTLLLLGAWVYTSWYWYTCNIKNLCNATIEKASQTTNNYMSDKKEELENTNGNTEVSQTELVEQGDLMPEAEDKLADAPKLSATDVLTLTEKNLKKEKPVEETTAEEETEEVSNSTETDETSGEDNNREDNTAQDSTQSETVDENLLCTSPLVGPIGLDKNNDTSEVKKLEAFLISQGASIEVDGVYGQDDFEEVKAFQLKYREKILDPWDINNPTGYVFRTTVKTINEVACNK